MNSPHRSFPADAVRVIAALAVLVIHLSDPLVFGGLVTGTMDWWIASFVDASVRWAVPLFVMLSGSLLLERRTHVPVRTFLEGRLRRLLMPSLLAFGLFFAWEAWWWGNPVTIWGAVLSVFYLQTRHLYFIPIILGLYLITPVLSRYWSHLDTKNRYAAVTILTVLIMSVTIILFLTGALSELRTAPFAWLLYLPYFLGGALLRDLRVSGLKAELLFAVALGISFVSAILVYLSAAGVFRFGTFGNYPFDHQSLPVMAQTAIVFVLVQSYANRLPALVRQFVTFVSPATLGIYLLHPFIQDILGTTVSLFKLPLVAPVVIVLPLQFGILFGCSLAISWLCSKAVRTLTRHA